jgi:hypothetical protein
MGWHYPSPRRANHDGVRARSTPPPGALDTASGRARHGVRHPQPAESGDADPDRIHDGAVITLVAVHGDGGGGFRFARLLEYVPDDVRLEAVTLPGFGDELGLPSVTDAAGPTGSVRTGDRITIDGRRGLVRVAR